jgi:hypothetical protein
VFKSRRIGWTGHVAHTGEMGNYYNILVGKSEEKRLFRRIRRRLENNIKMDLGGIGQENVNWILCDSGE